MGCCRGWSANGAMPKKRKTLNFKSASGYRRWLAYKEIHFPRSHGKDRIKIAGKAHKVKHRG